MANTATPYLSVVVPCYNEQENMEILYARLTAVCAAYADQGYELVFVNDGSKDQTWQHIHALHERDARVKGICLSRNFGHSMALTAGLDHCLGQRILIIDADLQDPPELLPQMMGHMDDGADVVYGKRINRDGETWFKRVSASLFYRLLNLLSDTYLPEDTGDFRLINQKVLQALRSMPENSRYTRGMIAWIGFKQIPLAYERQARAHGETQYTLRKMCHLALDGITGFSVHALRLAFYIGFLMLCLSFVLLGYIIYSYFFLDVVKGWASLSLLIVGSQAMQWFFLGLIGEYTGRIYQETKGRPHYFVMQHLK